MSDGQQVAILFCPDCLLPTAYCLLPLLPPPLPRLLSLRLGRDLFQLATLHGRQGLTGRAQFGVAEGAAVGLHPLRNGIEELALPFGQRNARLLCRAAGASEGVESGALGGFPLRFER